MPAAEAAVAAVAREGGALRFTGALLRDAVPGLWREALPLLDGVSAFDLGGVSRVDSAGVALLAELGTRAAGEVSIHGEPEGLSALRAAYRLSPSLGFAG